MKPEDAILLHKKTPTHRDLPRPPWFYDIHRGYCRWCGLPIRNEDGTLNRRRQWHRRCVEEYGLLVSPKALRRKVFERDQGICAKCGKQDKRRWDLDHIERLVNVPRNPYYWGLDNIQTLCKECHQGKTVKENALEQGLAQRR